MVGSTSDFYCSICGNRGFCNAWQYTYRCSTHGNKPKVTYYLCANCDPYTNYQTCDVQMSCTACSGTGNITVQNDCANCVGTGTINPIIVLMEKVLEHHIIIVRHMEIVYLSTIK